MPKAVIFDVDGTFVDSVDLHAHAWVDAFRDYGHPSDFAKVRAQIARR
jgi:beta-phosphoglucomutase-like phosphatase (HAD superfamily)